MLDRFKREINYLRVSVTDRCNLRCTYCMPAEGIKLLSHKDVLSLEEMADVVKAAVDIGVNKVRITGGEPLVRKGIVDFVKLLSRIEGINDLAMTSNAIFLDKYAQDLKNAGLHRVNISLDTVDPDKYKKITRGGDLKRVVAGIVAAQKAGLTPVKVNCVIHKSSDEADALGVKDFCEKMGLEIRYIHLMDLHKGEFSVVEGGEGGNCKICNRLRLTANGKLMPCLFSDIAYDVRKLGAKKALQMAIENKPECGSKSNDHEFYNIGG